MKSPLVSLKATFRMAILTLAVFSLVFVGCPAPEVNDTAIGSVAIKKEQLNPCLQFLNLIQ